MNLRKKKCTVGFKYQISNSHEYKICGNWYFLPKR